MQIDMGFIPFRQNYPKSDYGDVKMGSMTSQITSLTIVYSIVYSGADQTKYQSSASLAFVGGIYLWPVISPHKGPVMRKMFPFDDDCKHTLFLQVNRDNSRAVPRKICVITHIYILN